MLKPSDFLAVIIVVHHVWSQNLMAVAARVCMSVTQRQETAENLSHNCNTKLFRDLRDSHTHPTELERTSVCKFGVGVGHVLKSWNFVDSKTLGGSLATIETTHPDDKSVLQTSPACQTRWHQCCRNTNGCSRVEHKQGPELGCTSFHSWHESTDMRVG